MITLTLAEGKALLASVMGDAFSTPDLNAAVEKIRPWVEAAGPRSCQRCGDDIEANPLVTPSMIVFCSETCSDAWSRRATPNGRPTPNE